MEKFDTGKDRKNLYRDINMSISALLVGAVSILDTSQDGMKSEKKLVSNLEITK